MSQQFNEVRVGTSARSTFDLSHHQVTTTDFGYLIPICVRDMVPNDDYVVTPSLFTRLAPLAFPTYGRITCRVHSFFVPYRILYPHWNEFITQSSGNNTIPPYFTGSVLKAALDLDPQFSSASGLLSPRGIYGRLMANLGLNPSILASNEGFTTTMRFSAFRFLAYYRIWLDWFMDSNLNDHSQLVSVFNDFIKDGGSLSSTATEFLRIRCCCFGKDYFTTAKLHPQAGNASIVGSHLADSDLNPALVRYSTSSYSEVMYQPNSGKVKGADAGPGLNATDYIGQFTVEELRAAVSLQRYLERNNYVGTKVINQLLAHFGIAPTPERLDMSEYIGGSNFGIQIGDVTSTSPSVVDGVSTSNLGAQAGKGVGASQTETVRYHAKEHGVFMTLLSIVPDSGYYQGIPKEFTLGVTGDALDFYTPEFENLGFQEILNSEVWMPTAYDGHGEAVDSYDPDGIFGYSPRYAFLKFQHDILAGDFVGNLSSSTSSVMGAQMDAWHLFRKLAFYTSDEDPVSLNDNFVECNRDNNDFDRIFQVTNNELDHFYFNIDVDVKATRDMVGFAEPSLDSVNSEDGQKINLPYGGTRL